MPFLVLLESDATIEALFIRFCANNRQVYVHYCGLAGVENPDPHLTQWERLAIWIYSTTQGRWYRSINDALWDGNPSDDIEAICHLLTSGLKKLRSYQGKVYRGIRVENLNAFLARYKIDAEMDWPAFTSATIERAYAQIGNVSFMIQSQNGRVLGPYANYQTEQEVIFLPGSRFRVKAVERTANKAIIDLVEIAPSATSNEGETE